jgi:hypothetical protein
MYLLIIVTQCNQTKFLLNKILEGELYYPGELLHKYYFFACVAMTDFFTPKNPATSVALGYGLGAALGIGLGLTFLSESYVDLGLFMVFISIYHTWEYFYVALYQRGELSANSFLLNHSQEYTLAMTAGLTEYFLERWFLFPSLKGSFLAIFIGFILCAGGQSIRTLSM